MRNGLIHAALIAALLTIVAPAAASPPGWPEGPSRGSTVKIAKVSKQQAREGRARQARYLHELGSKCERTRPWRRGLKAVCVRGKVARIQSRSHRYSSVVTETADHRIAGATARYRTREGDATAASAPHSTTCSDGRGHTLVGVWGPRYWNTYAFRMNETFADNIEWEQPNASIAFGRRDWAYIELALGAQTIMGEQHQHCSAWSAVQGGDFNSTNNAGHVLITALGDTANETDRASLAPYCQIGDGGQADGENTVVFGAFHTTCSGYDTISGITYWLTDGNGHLTEADISMNNRDPRCTTADGDCDQVAGGGTTPLRDDGGHELGHAEGQDHTCVNHCSFNWMDANVGRGENYPQRFGLGDYYIQEFLYP